MSVGFAVVHASPIVHDFVQACCKGDVAGTQLNVKKFSPNPMTEDAIHFSLRVACSKGHFEVVQWMLDNLQVTNDGVLEYAFRGACSSGHLNVAKLLTDHFKFTANDVTKPSRYGESVLSDACSHGKNAIVLWLIEHFSLTAEHIRISGCISVRRACETGNLELAKSLVKKFALSEGDLRCIDNYALLNALAHHHFHVVQWLLENFNEQEPVTEKDLSTACSNDKKIFNEINNTVHVAKFSHGNP
jgi:hypothetical protein